MLHCTAPPSCTNKCTGNRYIGWSPNEYNFLCSFPNTTHYSTDASVNPTLSWAAAKLLRHRTHKPRKSAESSSICCYKQETQVMHDCCKHCSIYKEHTNTNDLLPLHGTSSPTEQLCTHTHTKILYLLETALKGCALFLPAVWVDSQIKLLSLKQVIATPPLLIAVESNKTQQRNSYGSQYNNQQSRVQGKSCKLTPDHAYNILNVQVKCHSKQGGLQCCDSIFVINKG